MDHFSIKNALSVMKRRVLVPILVLISLSFWTGCEEEVSPFVEDDRFFTVYGYLDTAVNEQFLRVIQLRTEFAAAGDTSIDAAVTTTEVETGVTTAWTDSLVTFDDGTIGHIFVGRFRPVPGLHYRLNVTRSDGKGASATTLVPPPQNVTVSEPALGFVGITQKVLWPQIDFIPFKVEVWYRTLDTAFEGLPFRDAVVLYGDDGGRVGRQTNNGWEIVVRYAEDKKEVGRQLGYGEGDQPILLSMGMRLTMSDEQWRPPDGVFNPEILVQPGTFSNVEGGFGFFGSLNQFALEWTLDEQATRTAGYTSPGKK
jgi:hypothetical protein